MEIDTPKGTKDDMPEDKILLNKLMDDIKNCFEIYGYSPIDTPVIERFDVLSSKYTGGSEILKETFKLTDQGNRLLGLRYDLTVPLARVISMHPDLRMPFKRYHIAKVWRDGPVSLGRLREFWQCDVDAIGIKSMIVDAELIAIGSSILSKFNLKFSANVNNRKLLNGILIEAGILENQERVILTLDKIEKIHESGVRQELSVFLSKEQIDKVLELISIKGANEKILSTILLHVKNEEGRQGIQELKELTEYCKCFGVAPKINLSLARGLAYYTGTIYEFFLENSEIKSAVVSGGRYDKMIGSLVGGSREFPAVGISIGVSRLFEVLKTESKKSVTEVFITPIGVLKEAIEIAQVLRMNGIKTDIDMMNRGPSKNLDFAGSLEIPHVILIGKKELSEGKVKLRDMRSGKEELMTVAEVIAKLERIV